MSAEIVKVPNVVRIGHYEFTVEHKPNLKLEDGYLGTTNFLTGKISIDPNLWDCQKTMAYLHEIIHVISENYECDLDESNISRIANGVAEWLDNVGIKLSWEKLDVSESIDKYYKFP